MILFLLEGKLNLGFDSDVFSGFNCNWEGGRMTIIHDFGESRKILNTVPLHCWTCDDKYYYSNKYGERFRWMHPMSATCRKAGLGVDLDEDDYNYFVLDPKTYSSLELWAFKTPTHPKAASLLINFPSVQTQLRRFWAICRPTLVRYAVPTWALTEKILVGKTYSDLLNDIITENSSKAADLELGLATITLAKNEYPVIAADVNILTILGEYQIDFDSSRTATILDSLPGEKWGLITFPEFLR